jgi:hypothetical protein
MTAIVQKGLAILALLLVATPAWAQAAGANALQGFSIVLVLGDVQDGASSDNIPAAARAALADLKDFLPYRSYRVLDTSWVLASSTTRQVVTSRVRGSDEQDYEVILDRMPLGSSSLQIHFEMREPDGNAERRAAIADREAALRAELEQMMAARAALENQLRRAEAGQNRGDADALRQRLADAELAVETRQKQSRYAPAGATLIDTSFTMSFGETVVVGTSRMRGGNKALIVLLTAATRSANKPRE